MQIKMLPVILTLTVDVYIVLGVWFCVWRNPPPGSRSIRPPGLRRRISKAVFPLPAHVRFARRSWAFFTLTLYNLIMKINDEEIEKIIKTGYGISVSNIIKLNIGFDQNTSVFKVCSKDNKEYFLKIRCKIFNKASLIIPLRIGNCINTKNIINAVKTINGKLFVKKSLSCFILYPYIYGKSGWDSSLTKDQFMEFGRFMKNLHLLDLPNESKKLLPVESYNSKYRSNVKKYLKKINKEVYDSKIINDFFSELITKKEVIMKIINTSEEIAEKEKNNLHKMCLCHGDIHAGNILINETDFFIIDWDTILFSPKEKDLMFIGGGICDKWNTEEEIEYFFAGYGKSADINKNLLKYFRHERIIQDVYEFYHQIINPQTREEERELCFNYFNEQFEQNNVVDMALRT